jgi:hypothetical protein
LLGGVVWLAFVWKRVGDLKQESWAHALLLLAALVLVPAALELIEDKKRPASRLQRWLAMSLFPAALLLTAAYLRDAGSWFSALAATPWVFLCLATAVRGVRGLIEGRGRQFLDVLCGEVACAFLGVGGLWVLADRTGYRPLGFEPAIVALTAVHFHFAGLLLPIFAGLATWYFPFSRMASLAAIGVVLGVPAVAVGITTTQLGVGPAIEAAAGCGLAVAGALVAILHVRIALDLPALLRAEQSGAFGVVRKETASGAAMASSRLPITRALFAVTGVSLFFGVALAAIYASRAFVTPLPWLDVPWMRALHGTVNALGFGVCGLFAWRRVAAVP